MWKFSFIYSAGSDRVLWWKSAVICVSGRKFRGISLVITYLPPSFPLSLSPAPEWRGSPCVPEGEGPRCAGPTENVVRAAGPLCIGEGRRERGGKEQEVSLCPPLLPRFPPSLTHYLFLSLSTLPLIILPSLSLWITLPTHKWLH